MRLTATDFYTLLRPARCDLRVHLTHRGEEAPAEPGVFEQLLFKLGTRHEAAHLATLREPLDLRGLGSSARLEATRDAVNDGAPVIYQGALRVEAVVGGIECEILGEPDFLIRQGSGYVVRDAKLSRRISRGEHPEIIASLQLYGWLFERTFGTPPTALEVAAGDGGIVPIDYDAAEFAIEMLEEVLAAKASSQEPFSPVGWSKCEPCGFRARCWEPAVARRDVAVLPDVDVGLVSALNDQGVVTIGDLEQRFGVDELADLRRPWGKKTQKVGKKAANILRNADAWERGTPIAHGPFAVPAASSYVMFDLEGLPPFQDELDRIYLWGFQPFGDCPGPYVGIAAETGPDGDQRAWEEFLAGAGALLDSHGETPWVHWSPYERTNLRKYVERYGDRDDVAARVDANLVDLLSVTKNALALPVPSYGLKVIEEYVGYQRSQSAYGGNWSIAQYIEAVECDDDNRRRELLEEIRTYNREDVEATWAVFEWVRGHVQRGS